MSERRIRCFRTSKYVFSKADCVINRNDVTHGRVFVDTTVIYTCIYKRSEWSVFIWEKWLGWMSMRGSLLLFCGWLFSGRGKRNANLSVKTWLLLFFCTIDIAIFSLAISRLASLWSKLDENDSLSCLATVPRCLFVL